MRSGVVALLGALVKLCYGATYGGCDCERPQSDCAVVCNLVTHYVSQGLHISESDFLLIRQNCDLNDFVFWRDSKQGADCLAGNGTLPSPLSGPSCAPGYLCAFAMELCNMYTWPQYCAPTVDCAIDMLQYQFCDAQNANQPMLCEAGHVCSVRTSYEMAEPQTQRRCPSGSYCVIGTSEPVDCGWMTYCKEGSDHPKQWGAFLLMAIADVCLFLIWRARRNRIVLQQQQVSAKAATRSSELQGSSSGVLMEPLLMDAETKEEGPAVAGDPIHTLVKGFVRVRGSLFSLDFAFDDLGLQLPNGTRILQSVSGRVTPAKVTAIMGPSGAGKTTMLHVLMGKVPPTFQRSGTLRINGKVTSMSAYKRSIGYVPQEDIMHRSLTVRDNIEYSARVRLPDDWTEEELMHHVDATLDVLQLSHVQHTVIGDERIRGVSGGQRKRVNIGMEVVAAPVALFLDEPTSGLDATAALTVTESLEQIAHAAGITVAMVVHQPRYEIWQSLDEVFFLGPGGRTVFLGAQKDVESYFLTQLRVQPTPKDNPADFFMDLICERGQECVEAWEEHVAQHPTAALGSQRISSVKSSSYEGITETDMQIDEPNQPLRGESGMPDVAELAELLRSGGAYGDVELQARLLLEINEEQICAAAAKGGVMKTRVSLAGLLSEITGTRRGADFFTQTRLAHNRSIKQQLNDSTGILIELVTISFAGLLMGFASKFVFEGILEEPYTLLSPSSQVVIVPQTAMFVGMAVGLAAGPPGVNTFGQELVIYWREAAVGHNKLAYYIGRSFSMMYRIALCSLHFAALYLIQCEQVVTTAELYTVTFAVFFAVYGLASIVSVIIPIQTASLVAVVVALIAPVFGGYVRNLPDVMKKISYAWWANEAFFSYATDDFNGIYMVEKSADVFDYILDQTGKDIFVAFMIGFIYRIITYFCMIGLNRDKQS